MQATPKDIENYLRYKLQEQTHHIGKSLKEDIIRTITNKAHGMFIPSLAVSYSI
jgi:hypothetical protein